MKIALIGSSPAMLLQALLLSKKFRNIEIHERNKKLGGSWKTSTFYNLKSIETGTHILAPWKNKVIYEESLKILKNKLGLKLFLVKPAPERIINKNIKKTELKKIRYYYVKGGAKKILENIYYLIKKKNIKIKYNSNIKKIVFGKKKKLISSKKTFLADQIYLPYYCDFNKNFLKKNYLMSKKKLSVHIVIEFINFKKFPRKFSYLQCSNFSKWIDRVSILSGNILLKKEKLFCLRLSNDSKNLYKRNPKTLAKIISNDLFNYLNYNKYKNKFNFRHKYFEYETSYRDKGDKEKFKKFVLNKNLKIVDTSELMKYIGKNLKNLKKLDNYV